MGSVAYRIGERAAFDQSSIREIAGTTVSGPQTVSYRIEQVFG